MQVVASRQQSIRGLPSRRRWAAGEQQQQRSSSSSRRWWWDRSVLERLMGEAASYPPVNDISVGHSWQAGLMPREPSENVGWLVEVEPHYPTINPCR